MSLEVKIPSMGESISSGILAKWHVKDGEAVKKDQPLFELETDKITSEGAAEAAGKISLVVAAGAEVKIVARILDERGEPNILEVNPLPGILPKPEDNSCLPKAARTAGYTYDGLILRVADEAAARWGLAGGGRA